MTAPAKLTEAEFAERRSQVHPLAGLIEDRYQECPLCGGEGPAKPGGRRDGKGRLNQCPKCNGTMRQAVRWLPVKETPDGLLARLLTAVGAEIVGEPLLAPMPTAGRRFRRLMAGAKPTARRRLIGPPDKEKIW